MLLMLTHALLIDACVHVADVLPETNELRLAGVAIGGTEMQKASIPHTLVTCVSIGKS